MSQETESEEFLYEHKFVISVKTNHQFTEEDLDIIKYDFRARLEGYYTKCPPQLIDADVSIKGLL